ncbi:phosphatase PAP2 family protein [Chryseobacterium sp. SC28]|uniref:phosphatase PAP2 family protein n=1 Tax=Chryseobacterium sp. SC28 TaxID=2268028 RepID=UPI000F64CC55|nr:phosphatase PAP2 family protein [Chryseobacterium sp. SC28]RRQ46152.1 phosphatase PAP2 family protein [Chryseobacterium sp. SC28]
MNGLIEKDQQLLLFLNGLGNSVFDPFWITVSEKWIWIPFYAILLYLLYKSFPLRKLIFILLFVAIGITISDQLANIFKHGIHRLRPCHTESLMHRMRLVLCGGKYGFYSGHSSNSFFLFSFLTIMIGKKYKYLPYILFVWASIVAYSRIYLGVHFPLDIAFGAAVGFLLGGLLAELAKKVVNKPPA